jgi:hypothetical protein
MTTTASCTSVQLNLMIAGIGNAYFKFFILSERIGRSEGNFFQYGNFS